MSGVSQAGAGALTSTCFSVFNCVNCSVLNATFNSTSVTPGIRSSLLVTGCSVTNVNDIGTGSAPGIALNFFANSTGQVTNCRVDNSEAGILTLDRCQILNCTVVGCNTIGIQTGQCCSVVDCTVSGNGIVATGAGISVDIRSQVLRCNSNDNTGDGIAVLGGCRVEGCIAENSTTGSGIPALPAGSGSRIESNHVRDNHRYGVEAGAGDVIARNTSGSNTLGAYLPVSGVNLGPIQTPSTATNPMANF